MSSASIVLSRVHCTVWLCLTVSACCFAVCPALPMFLVFSTSLREIEGCYVGPTQELEARGVGSPVMRHLLFSSSWFGNHPESEDICLLGRYPGA